MKRILAPVGRILAVMAIYYAAQYALTAVFGVVYTVINGIRIESFPRFLQELTRYVLDVQPYVVLISALVALASYYVIYRDRTQDVRAFLRYRPLDAAAIAMLVVFGIGVNFVIALLLTLMKSLPFLEPMFESYEALSEVIMEGNFAVTLLSVGIIGPIAEEVMFRGLIFGELRKIMPIKVALVVQAVLFGAHHLQPVQGAYAAVIGVLLGLVYYRSGSILAPVIVHIAVNSFSIISSTLMPDTENYAGAGLIVIAGLLFFVLSSAYILVSRNFKYVIDDSLYRMSRRKPCSPDQTARNQ